MGGFTQVKEGALATEVLGDQLGGFITPEKEDFYATQYELTTGIVLRRSTEVIFQGIKPAEADKREKAYQARRAAFLEEHPPQPKRKLSMDPESARRTLKTMERRFRSQEKPRTKLDKEKAADDYQFMNGCRVILGMPPHDYEKEPLEDPAETLNVEYHDFQKHPEPAERVALVREMVNQNLVRLIAAHDNNDRVRVAAEERLGALQVLGKTA